MTSATQQAVILAAGRGSRMLTLTEDRPKCLVNLDGRPILAWTLDALRANGITDVLIIGGWRYQDLNGWCDELRVNAQWSTTNMVRSLMLANDWLSRAPSLVVYGDGAYGAKCLGDALKPTNSAWAVPVDRLWQSLWRRRFPEPLDDAETLIRNGVQLVSIGQRAQSLAQIQGQFMGLLHLQPAAWSRASRWLHDTHKFAGSSLIDRLDMTGLLNALLNAGEYMECVDVDGGWVEIDSGSDLRAIEQALNEGGFTHDFRM